MQKYDSIVVGSGISGLTIALLLGLNGHSVLLLEKKSKIGGSMSRFYKQGIPFDTGFHFSGGLKENDLLDDMLKILGIHKEIQPISLSADKTHRIIFEDDQVSYDIPLGIQNIITQLIRHFPLEKYAIEQYFKMMKNVCNQTPSMNIKNISHQHSMLDEDYISLTEVLNNLTDNKHLKSILSIHCMCYGVKPAEISFANHSRITFPLCDSVSRVKDGGDAFVSAFHEKLSRVNVDICCNRYIVECADIKEKKVGRFILSNGEEISCNDCIFTIHPKEILNTIPVKCFSKAFISRVNAFEPTNGFFSLFGVLNSKEPLLNGEQNFVSFLPVADNDVLFDQAYAGKPAMVVMNNIEKVNGVSKHVFNALAVSFVESMKQWNSTMTGNRPQEYYAYKQHLMAQMKDRIIKECPEYNGILEIIDGASLLTFRDYLLSPDGSAYGIKQKIGQFSLFGKLPLRNLYVAGQSSILPGIMGSMLSSFMLANTLVGKDDFNHFIEGNLCN